MDVSYQALRDADSLSRIKSYINNLHPKLHQDLYHVIEQVLACVLPLWNVTLSSWPLRPKRIDYPSIEYEEIPEEEKPRQEPDESDDDFW